MITHLLPREPCWSPLVRQVTAEALPLLPCAFATVPSDLSIQAPTRSQLGMGRPLACEVTGGLRMQRRPKCAQP